MSDPIYAGFWRRALAASLDNLTWLFGVLFIFGSLPINPDHVSGTATGVGVLVVLSLWFNYFAFCEWRWGQTIGKNAFGIEVRSLDGAERLTFSQASARNLLRLIDFFVIGEVMIVADGRRQRLGDKVANTVVVRRAPRAERAAPVPST
ncbi:MAG: RDD family protein, partial [Solirubrobacterales bacterium]